MDEQASRRGTKERILKAAEELFAERGFDATSLRDVTTVAGANLAAVNYHFGSKEQLLRAVIHGVLRTVNEQRQRRLSEIEGVGREPSVEALLEAFVYPVFDLSESERGRVIARLIGRAMGDPSQAIRQMVIEEVGEVEHAYHEALRRVLPDVPWDELWWRFRSGIGVLVSHLSGLLADQSIDVAPPEGGDNGRAWTITFLAAALRAPATPQPGQDAAIPTRVGMKSTGRERK